MNAVRLTLPSLKVLRVILDQHPRRVSGFGLHRQTGVATGTLYPMLLRFVAAGWLAWRWENIDPSAAGRPRRRYYWLTPVGKAQAEAALGALVSEKGETRKWSAV